jgi:hypothetical protein
MVLPIMVSLRTVESDNEASYAVPEERSS